MIALIKKIKHTKPVYTPERCYINELSSGAEDSLLSIALATVRPGITTVKHRLNQVGERYLIVSGQGRMGIDNLSPVDVYTGDVVIIPPGRSQYITNTGNTDLQFFCVCSPPFTEKCYESLE